MAVGDIQKELLPHLLSSLLKPPGIAEGAKSLGAAKRTFGALLTTARRYDRGKAVAWIAALKIALDDFFDDGLKEAALPLESFLIFRQDPSK